MWNIAKTTGRPLHEDLLSVWDWPHTITYAVMLRQRYDSYLELIEPVPEEYWDYPQFVRAHVDKLYPSLSSNKSSTGTTATVDIEDIED